MKRIFAFVLTLITVFSAVACFASCSDNSGKIVVGICNYVDDASLNQIVDNIQTQLEKLAKDNGKEIKIVLKNAGADNTVMSQIVSGFVADNVDLMIGVATPVAMTMQAKTEDNQISVVFAAVSDPVSAELVNSLENPGANITGTSDYLNTDALVNLMLAVNPNAKKIGLLYDVGQDSSKTPIAKAKQLLEEKGIAYVEKSGSTTSEISQAVDALISEGVDAVFTPTDNTIMTAELAIYEKLADAGIPHYAGADSFALNGAFVGYGVNYAQLGVETANIAGQILFEGKKPAEISVMQFENGTATVNTEICAKLGLDFETVKAAIAPYCSKVETIVTAEDFGE